jgi:hypothetical protein
VCALIQVVIDVLVFETTECVWLNFFVPRTVNTEVVTAAAALTALVESVVLPVAQREKKDRFFLNAAAQLFVSMRLAKAHPQLPESLIIGTYSNHLPGEICKTWPHYQLAEEQREVAVTKSLFPRSFLRGLTLAAQVCLTIPYVYQRVILRFAQPVIFSAISVVWFVAIQSTASIAALCAVFAAGAGYWYWRQYQALRAAVQRQATNLHAATAAVPSTSVSAILDTFGGDDEGLESEPHRGFSAGSRGSSSATSGQRSPTVEKALQELLVHRNKDAHSASSQGVSSVVLSSQSDWDFDNEDAREDKSDEGNDDIPIDLGLSGGSGDQMPTEEDGGEAWPSDADDQSIDWAAFGEQDESPDLPGADPVSYFSGSEWGDSADGSQWGDEQLDGGAEEDFWNGRHWAPAAASPLQSDHESSTTR